jgi:hypothetical protein
MKSAPSIAFDYRPSRVITLASVAVAIVAVLAPWLSGSPLLARIALSLLAIAFAMRAIRAHARPAFRRIVRRASGWCLVDRDGREWPAILLSHRRLGALLMLEWRHGPRARFRALIAPDNLHADTRRRLVLLLARGEPVIDDALGMPRV